MSSYHGGLQGEEAAMAYLSGLRMRILTSRYRAEGGEIDIIALDGQVLCFIEVKYRPLGRLGEGLLSVTWDKRRRIQSAAKAYLRDHRHPARWRFDTLEITRAGIWYARNAARSS
ncbi:MAG: YraN family protein [Christensenellales bacterium]